MAPKHYQPFPPPSDNFLTYERVREPSTWEKQLAETGLPLSQGPVMMQPERITLTPQRWKQLQDINRNVNGNIAYANDMLTYGKPDRWNNPLGPDYRQIRTERGLPLGDCEDYALAKQAALLQEGWPPESLSIAILPGHGVLMVHTDRGDFILDNAREEILSWDKSYYRFTEVQAGAGSARFKSIDTTLMDRLEMQAQEREQQDKEREANEREAAYQRRYPKQVYQLGEGQEGAGLHVTRRVTVTVNDEKGPLDRMELGNIEEGTERFITIIPDATRASLYLSYGKDAGGAFADIPYGAIDTTGGRIAIDTSQLDEIQQHFLGNLIEAAKEMGVSWDGAAAGETVTLPSVEQLRAATAKTPGN